MLEFYFSYRGVLKRLRSGALGAEMDRIAGDLHSQGYKPASAKLYLSRLARFSHFADKRCGSEPIRATIVDRYLRTLGAGSPRISAMTALQHARRVAPDRFVTAVSGGVDDTDAALLNSFSEHLSKVRGLEPKSRDGALLGARRFLQWFCIRHPGQYLRTLHRPNDGEISAIRHLTLRGRNWQFRRRVQSEWADRDPRGEIRTSTGTCD